MVKKNWKDLEDRITRLQNHYKRQESLAEIKRNETYQKIKSTNWGKIALSVAGIGLATYLCVGGINWISNIDLSDFQRQEEQVAEERIPTPEAIVDNIAVQSDSNIVRVGFTLLEREEWPDIWESRIYLEYEDGSREFLTDEVVKYRNKCYIAATTFIVPDGNQIVFTGLADFECDGSLSGEQRFEHSNDIFIMDIDGNNLDLIAGSVGYSRRITSVSPDGKKVLVSQDNIASAGYYDLIKIGIDDKTNDWITTLPHVIDAEFYMTENMIIVSYAKEEYISGNYRDDDNGFYLAQIDEEDNINIIYGEAGNGFEIEITQNGEILFPVDRGEFATIRLDGTNLQSVDSKYDDIIDQTEYGWWNNLP